MANTLPPEIVELEAISPHPNLLVFAKSGAGKTVWACSDDSVLVLNCEPEGTLSAKQLGSKAKEWTCRTYKDFVAAVEWLKGLVDRDEPIPFKVISIDSITALQKLLMRDILDGVISVKPHRDADIPDRPEYLKNQLVIQRIVKEVNDLPVMVVWTSLVRKETDPEGNDFLFPAVQGKGYEIAQSILAMMTSFGYLYVKVRRNKDSGKPIIDPTTKAPIRDRYIMWEDSGVMQGKDRTCVLGPYTRNLTLKQVRERIENAGIQGNPEPEQKKLTVIK
jgi:AAA domain-containing protein